MIVGGWPRRSPISSLSSLIWVSVGLVVSPNPNLICVLSTPVEKNCRRFWDRPRSSVLGRDHLDSSKIFIVIFSAIVQWVWSVFGSDNGDGRWFGSDNGGGVILI
ncbi:hypothetical protein QYF36_006708 [Acer negundo]|nr:hypothetical protein QYF36_006708 [Acer negundo]